MPVSDSGHRYGFGESGQPALDDPAVRRPRLELAEHAYLLETGRIVMDGPSAVIGADESIRRSYLGY